MTEFLGKPVVVGVDGSASGLTVARLAAQEAVLRESPLRVVHGFLWPRYQVPHYADVRRDAERIVDLAVAVVSSLAPWTLVTGHVIDGEPGRSYGWSAAMRGWPFWD